MNILEVYSLKHLSPFHEQQITPQRGNKQRHDVGGGSMET